MTNKKFFVGQKALIERNSEVLILITPQNGLDFPGGQIQVGETTISTSLQREVKEETNLKIEVGKPFHTWIVDFSDKSLFFIAYICTYISGEVKISSEHMNFKWVNKQTYKTFTQNSIWFRVLEKYFLE